MDFDYATQYRSLYERHWWWRSREEEILRVLDRQWNASSSEKEILDVGCGDGLFFDKLSKYGTVTGVESDPATLSSGGKWRRQIYCQPFDNEFQPGKQYDAILMLDILEHMPDPEGALRHARSLLNEGGILLATVPAFMSLWTSHDDINHHVIRYTKGTFEPLVEQGGFHSLESRYLFHWTFPAKLAIRLKERLLPSIAQPPTVPKTWINSLCLALTRFEHATLSRLPMPFGSSLMVVAEPT